MIIDANLPPVGLKDVPGIAAAAEAMGFAAIWSTETMHDPFLPAALAFEHTSRLEAGTAVAIAFARSPANIAYTAWDLAQFSHGRFLLGLGTQVKAHVERRFGMPWPASVVGKLREQITAIRLFWKTWQTGEPLKFQGAYYHLSLMTPFFNPGPIDCPDIPIYIAGVNTGLARLAGEAANGFVAHPFHSVPYLQEVILPAIEQGAEKAGRAHKDVTISASVFVVTSPAEDAFVRQQLSFYASTPSYRPVMAQHGWEQTAEELSGLAARGRWGEMPALITDAMLDTFAVVAGASDLRQAVQDRYQGIADRLGLYIPFVPGDRDAFWRAFLA